MDSTEESERMDVFSKEDFQTEEKQEVSKETVLKEMDELIFNLAQVGVLAAVDSIIATFKPVCGRAGLRAIAKTILSLPLTGESDFSHFSTETETITREFLKERKIEQDDLASRTPKEEAQVALAGN